LITSHSGICRQESMENGVLSSLKKVWSCGALRSYRRIDRLSLKRRVFRAIHLIFPGGDWNRFTKGSVVRLLRTYIPEF
jgi:hypothetical protein